MESNYFYFNGRRSTDYGLYLLSAPDIPWPARQAERVEVPGRNGSLRIGTAHIKMYPSRTTAFLQAIRPRRPR